MYSRGAEEARHSLRGMEVKDIELATGIHNFIAAPFNTSVIVTRIA